VSEPDGAGKLGAYREASGQAWDTARDEHVLYLGAAEGHTAEWVAQLVPEGQVVAVETSPVAGLGLVDRARELENIVPYFGDARQPDTYAPIVPELGVLYQDVAQQDQVEIFLENAHAFEPRRGFLAVKARSIAVERPPSEVFDEAITQIEDEADVLDVVRLEPHHVDHAMIACEFDGA